MSTAGAEGDELRSWKEIADYLGVSIRTAQLWEAERALPVKRLPGGRSRVSALAAELETWKKSSIPSRRHSRWVASAAVTVAVLASAFLYSRPLPQPASFRLEGNCLVVQDSRGRELWRKIFGSPLARPSAKQVWFGDIDGDGQTEVLFVPLTEFGSAAPLICYSRQGDERWRFQPGRVLTSAAQTFAPIFLVRQFAVFALDRHRKAIAVTSNHYLHYPGQVALLSERGVLLREYWHSGHLDALAIADFDADGIQEIYAAGISNAYRGATLVVLDPRNFQGASAETSAPEYQIRGFARGNERVRLIFPRTCISKMFEQYNAVHDLVVEPEQIVVNVREKMTSPFPFVTYRFSRKMQLDRVIPSDVLQSFHRELESAGKLDHGFAELELAELNDVRDLAGGELTARRSRRASSAAGRLSSRGGR